MSSSIAIPKRKKRSESSGFSPQSPATFSASSLSASESLPRTPGTAESSSPSTRPKSYARRPSLLSSSISKSEHTVVNIGQPDAPRLITCVRASQGFDWNQEIFLPSYVDHDTIDLERKPDPVEDIILTDEEAAAILPQ